VHGRGSDRATSGKRVRATVSADTTVARCGVSAMKADEAANDRRLVIVPGLVEKVDVEMAIDSAAQTTILEENLLKRIVEARGAPFKIRKSHLKAVGVGGGDPQIEQQVFLPITILGVTRKIWVAVTKRRLPHSILVGIEWLRRSGLLIDPKKDRLVKPDDYEDAGDVWHDDKETGWAKDTVVLAPLTISHITVNVPKTTPGKRYLVLNKPAIQERLGVRFVSELTKTGNTIA
jgi:hypothetical protein